MLRFARDYKHGAPGGAFCPQLHDICPTKDACEEQGRAERRQRFGCVRAGRRKSAVASSLCRRTP